MEKRTGKKIVIKTEDAKRWKEELVNEKSQDAMKWIQCVPRFPPLDERLS